MRYFKLLMAAVVLTLALAFTVTATSSVQATGTATVRIVNQTNMAIDVYIIDMDMMMMLNPNSVRSGVVLGAGSHSVRLTTRNSDMMMVLQTDMMMIAGHTYDMMLRKNGSNLDMMMVDTTH